MKKQMHLYLGAALLAAALPAVAPAAIEGITGVEIKENRWLTSVTVGDYTITADSLVHGTSRGDAVWPCKIAQADNLNLHSVASRLYHDSVWTITQLGGAPTFTDSNGNHPDFFLFEAGMNDSFTVKAILADGTLGQAVAVDESTWGDTGLKRAGIYNYRQPIGGIAFAITDLLDENGLSLTNDAAIAGIQITSPTLDPVSFTAVVPEPATIVLLGVGSLWLRRRRRS